jgi:hypothetical protein
LFVVAPSHGASSADIIGNFRNRLGKRHNALTEIVSLEEAFPDFGVGGEGSIRCCSYKRRKVVVAPSHLPAEPTPPK